ncbi:hypothetical protein GGF46_004836 [Coemansia sp. RSA 552]|nr:hypothetical protein GGF46_004836 [Coemansia sp. RSA 552]
MTWLLAAVLSALACASAGLEINLEWSTTSTDAATISSLLRLTNDTAPPLTEWIALGWEHGSLSLKRSENNANAQIVMQLTPPSPKHQVLLGRASGISQTESLGTGRVEIKTGVSVEGAQPYYFKVEAHHDIAQNRTTYEGLYSLGDHWMYMGSLVLQHPVDKDAQVTAVTRSVTDAQPLQAEDAAPSASYAPLNLLKNGITFESPPAFPRLFSGIRRLDHGDATQLRAGVFKQFQTRDRLGDTSFVSKARAYLYDSTDDDVAMVRHYSMAASYLLSIDGPRAKDTDVEEITITETEDLPPSTTSTSTT